jgi:hypothetical protein
MSWRAARAARTLVVPSVLRSASATTNGRHVVPDTHTFRRPLPVSAAAHSKRLVVATQRPATVAWTVSDFRQPPDPLASAGTPKEPGTFRQPLTVRRRTDARGCTPARP